MIITCRTLQDFLTNVKINDADIRLFYEELYNTGDCKIKEVVLAFYKGERKNKSAANQKAELWNLIENRTFEAYSEAFLDKHKDSALQPHRIFYRGVANKDYKLVSGIYRNKEKEENYYFHELQVRCPSILAHLRCFNKLTYMQHYGSPTRLLDITANPLVGLYFACERHFEIDGKVSVFGIRSDEIAYETSDRVQMLTHLQELTKVEQEQLQKLSYLYIFGKFPQNTNSKYTDPEVERLYYNTQKENYAFKREIKPLDMLYPVFVQANQDNPRILKQDGAFIMSALNLNETDSDSKLKKHVVRELIIPADCKKTILSDLETLCCIHKASLFPELDTVSQYLRNK